MIQATSRNPEAKSTIIELPLTTIKAGQQFDFLVSLADIPGIQPTQVVSPTYLLIPKSVHEHFSLVSVKIDRSTVNLASEPPRVSTELPTADAYFLDMLPMPPIFKLVVTVQNNTDTDQPFSAQLTCQIRTASFMWSGIEGDFTRAQKLGFVASQLGFHLAGWLHSRADHVRKSKSEQDRMISEEEEVFEPTCDHCPEPYRERLRDHLRLLAIDVVSAMAFPFKAALHLTTKALSDLTTVPAPEPTGNYLLDCGKTSVEAGKAANINVQCQISFRPSMLIIPLTIAGHFDISDIKVGRNSQFLATRSLPASAFSFSNGMPIPLKMDVLRPGQWVTIAVQNNSENTQAFTATLVGKTERWDTDEGN